MRVQYSHKIVFFLKSNLEAIIWLTALVLLGLMNPENSQPSLCLFHQFGIESCPGCGLGHAISLAFHGQFIASFHQHWFGLVAIAVLCTRIFTVFYQYFEYQKLKSNFHGENL
jgi:hypothetical protein